MDPETGAIKSSGGRIIGQFPIEHGMSLSNIRLRPCNKQRSKQQQLKADVCGNPEALAGNAAEHRLNDVGASWPRRIDDDKLVKTTAQADQRQRRRQCNQNSFHGRSAHQYAPGAATR
jgi:hypothetical protein